MKITVRPTKGPSFTLWFPAGLLLRPKLLQMGLSYSRRYHPAVPLDIPPDALKRLRKALKTYRGLRIVDVHSAEGDIVKITL